MSATELPQLTDTSWQGQYNWRLKCANLPEYREHFLAELRVMEPTLRAMGITVGGIPPPVQIAAHVPPKIGDPPPQVYPYTGDDPPPAINLFSKEVPQGKISLSQADTLAVELVHALMKEFGFTKAQAAGIVGNLYHESAGLNPHVNEFYWKYPEGDSRNYGAPFLDNPYGYGWAQWSAERKFAYVAYVEKLGLLPGSPAANYAFLVYEMRTTEFPTIAAVQATTTPEEAAIAFRKVFERAAMPNDPGRTAAAQRFYEMA